MAKIGFVGFGEVNTPVDVIMRKCKAAEEALTLAGSTVFKFTSMQSYSHNIWGNVGSIRAHGEWLLQQVKFNK